jgi:hypothetical protein
LAACWSVVSEQVAPVSVTFPTSPGVAGAIWTVRSASAGLLAVGGRNNFGRSPDRSLRQEREGSRKAQHRGQWRTEQKIECIAL